MKTPPLGKVAGHSSPGHSSLQLRLRLPPASQPASRSVCIFISTSPQQQPPLLLSKLRGDLLHAFETVSFSHDFVGLLFCVFLDKLEETFCCSISWPSYIYLFVCLFLVKDASCWVLFLCTLQLSFKKVLMPNTGKDTQQSSVAFCNQPNQPNLEATGKKGRWCSKTNQSLWRIDFCQLLLNGLKTSRQVPFFPRHKADSPPLEINDNHSVDLPAKAVNYTCTAYPPLWAFYSGKIQLQCPAFCFFFPSHIQLSPACALTAWLQSWLRSITAVRQQSSGLIIL